MPSLDDLRLPAAETGLLLVDFQERLAAAMPEAERPDCERRISILIEAFRILNLPVVVSEQYPKGLGPTVPVLETALAAGPLQLHRFEKLHFACTDDPSFTALWTRLGRKRWIVVGMETHVCVYQTVRGLRALGAQVFVPADAVLSRTPANRSIGLDLCTRAGAIVSSLETVVFDLLGRAGTDEFKQLSKLLR